MNPQINRRLRSNIDLDIHNTTVPSSDWNGTGWDQGDDSSLPVCSVCCTVHLQLFISISTFNLGILMLNPFNP